MADHPPRRAVERAEADDLLLAVGEVGGVLGDHPVVAATALGGGGGVGRGEGGDAGIHVSEEVSGRLPLSAAQVRGKRELG